MVPRLGLYLEEHKARGRPRFQDAAEAAEVFVGDQQVRRLPGSLSEPEPAQVEARAERAVRLIPHAVRDRLTRSPSGGRAVIGRNVRVQPAPLR